VDEKTPKRLALRLRRRTLFQYAIVRAPAENFAEGLTTVDFGRPQFTKVLAQHAAYCEVLEERGLELIRLAADLTHPDSTFVEDAAVLTAKSAVLTRPGAQSRLGEVAAIRGPLERYYSTIHEIQSPGTLDGGDVCEAGPHFFIGVSHRTNEEGARQLSDFLAVEGYTSSVVDIRNVTSILHLKSGLAYLDDNNLVVMEELAERKEFAGYNLIRVSAEESYACNCVLVNERVLLPSGFPGLNATLVNSGYRPLLLDMSEFRKMDGGLSCLSLRF
jgi:dimethylargininase